MVGIILFAISVMYTPGPVNIISLNNGAQRSFVLHIPFCFGVASALGILFLFIGYTGSLVVNENMLPFIATAGTCFIVYLAYKIVSTKADAISHDKTVAILTFKDGLLMQLLNPKSMLVVLPVTAVQFPAVGIEGIGIAVWSVALGALGFGAPLAYAVCGAYLFRKLKSVKWLQLMNTIMGIMLLVVAAEMAYSNVYLVLFE